MPCKPPACGRTLCWLNKWDRRAQRRHECRSANGEMSGNHTWNALTQLIPKCPRFNHPAFVLDFVFWMSPGALLCILLAQFYISQTTQLGCNEMEIIKLLKSQYHISMVTHTLKWHILYCRGQTLFQLSYHVETWRQKQMNFHLKEILK